MTTGDVIVSPVQKVEDFFKTNKAASPETLEKRDALNDVLDEFHRKFPMTGLKALTLADYAFGDGGNDSFCWWLEYKLWEQGLYSGQAGKFKIYWKKDINDYVKLGFVKDVQDNDKAMEMVAEQVSNAANEIDLDTAVTKLSKGFVLKILNSYHPDTYFPVNNEKCINNILRILDIPLTGKNLFEKNKAIQEYFLSKKSVFSADVTNVEFMVFLFTNFDIQGEIEVKDDGIVSSGEYQLIQFHPSYSYEDFVRGITVSTDGGALPVYEVTNKILADFAGKAHNNPSSNYVLIIDEINRANLSSVLGELIYALEYRFDRNNPNETSVESMYALPSDEIDGEESRTLSLPRNLYILGTMNTADRSVGHIDYAIRRRFAFVDVLPKELPDAIFETEMFRRVSALFVKDINAMELEPSPYLSSEFKPKDVWLGHSYFIKQEDAGAATRFRYEILPILEEYIKDGVLLDNDDLRQEMKKLKAAYQ
ncbi:MAG: restriction endonuclease [Chitinophagaceae bacterium]|nr:MAG: restriction endonuclease [Chitinophagaceae bacterium]